MLRIKIIDANTGHEMEHKIIMIKVVKIMTIIEYGKHRE
jgi:hypothetical protein